MLRPEPMRPGGPYLCRILFTWKIRRHAPLMITTLDFAQPSPGSARISSGCRDYGHPISNRWLDGRSHQRYNDHLAGPIKPAVRHSTGLLYECGMDHFAFQTAPGVVSKRPYPWWTVDGNKCSDVSTGTGVFLQHVRKYFLGRPVICYRPTGQHLLWTQWIEGHGTFVKLINPPRILSLPVGHSHLGDLDSISQTSVPLSPALAPSLQSHS